MKCHPLDFRRKERRKHFISSTTRRITRGEVNFKATKMNFWGECKQRVAGFYENSMSSLTDTEINVEETLQTVSDTIAGEQEKVLRVLQEEINVQESIQTVSDAITSETTKIYRALQEVNIEDTIQTITDAITGEQTKISRALQEVSIQETMRPVVDAITPKKAMISAISKITFDVQVCVHVIKKEEASSTDIIHQPPPSSDENSKGCESKVELIQHPEGSGSEFEQVGLESKVEVVADDESSSLACALYVANAIMKLPGIQEAIVNIWDNRVQVTFDPTIVNREYIQEAIDRAMHNGDALIEDTVSVRMKFGGSANNVERFLQWLRDQDMSSQVSFDNKVEAALVLAPDEEAEFHLQKASNDESLLDQIQAPPCVIASNRTYECTEGSLAININNMLPSTSKAGAGPICVTTGQNINGSGTQTTGNVNIHCTFSISNKINITKLIRK